MSDIKKPKSTLKSSAEAVRRSRYYRKVIPPIICAITLLLVILYLLSLALDGYGSFTISVKDYGNRKYALTLCENDNFKKISSRLNATPAKNIDNIAASILPSDLNDVNGSHNGENYIAYTFYVKNTGEEVCSYKYTLMISRATLGIDAAARVRLYFNADYYKAVADAYTYKSDYVDFAKPKTGGNGEPEIDPVNRKMTNFLSGDVITEAVVNDFQPGDISKITVVIWLEGNDPDCTDDVLGGQFKTDMVFEIDGNL